MTRSPFILAGVAALMGAAGVALAAAGVHANGGELAQRGALFLLLHAVAALAIAAHARIAPASARAWNSAIRPDWPSQADRIVSSLTVQPVASSAASPILR